MLSLTSIYIKNIKRENKLKKEELIMEKKLNTRRKKKSPKLEGKNELKKWQR